MGKVLDLLSPGFVEQRIDACRQAVESGSGPQALVEGLSRKALSDAAHPVFKADRPIEAPPIKSAMMWAALEHARGSPPQVVRRICWDMAAKWLAVVQAMDFTPREHVVEDGLLPSAAQRLARQFSGIVTRRGNYAGVRYTSIPQPCSLDMPRVWMVAAVSGDRDLARSLARAYRHREPHEIDAASKTTVRETILAYLLADDEERAAELATKLSAGYATDWPPDRMEFPLGVVRRDGAVLLAGMKAVTTRFKGMWDVKKHERWYAAQLKKPSRVVRRLGSWEDVLARVRRDLVSLDWIMSWWALAWLNVARWRGGMEELFEDRTAFSEWVPRELCL